MYPFLNITRAIVPPFLIMLTAVVGVEGSASVDELQARRDELAGIARDIEEKTRKREEAARSEKSLLLQLEEIEEEIALQEEYLKKVSSQLESLSTDILEHRNLKERQEIRLAERRKLMARRLYGLYVGGQHLSWRVLFTSPSLNDFKRRYHYLKMIACADRHLVDRLMEEISRMATILETIRRDTEEQESLLLKGRKHRKDLAVRVDEKRGMVKDVLSRRSSYEKAVSRLEKTHRELEEIIRRIEDEKRKKLAQAGEDRLTHPEEGKFMWPVGGRVLSDFGRKKHPRFYTVTFNKGIDIEAREGEDVVAASSGEVAFVGWLHGLGRCVIIDHGRSVFTLYGHLSEILVDRGDTVNAGRYIGRAGMSGLVQDSQVHFEVWKRRKAEDPEHWLKERG